MSLKCLVCGIVATLFCQSPYDMVFMVIKMNIQEFIKSHKELNELPFLIVFRTLCILKSMNMLKFSEGDADVEAT